MIIKIKALFYRFYRFFSPLPFTPEKWDKNVSKKLKRKLSYAKSKKLFRKELLKGDTINFPSI